MKASQCGSMGGGTLTLTPQACATLSCSTVPSSLTRIWHEVDTHGTKSAASLPTPGSSDQRSCQYLWGSTATRQQQDFPGAVICTAHCTLLGAHLHSDWSVCWIFVEPSTCFPNTVGLSFKLINAARDLGKWVLHSHCYVTESMSEGKPGGLQSTDTAWIDNEP